MHNNDNFKMTVLAQAHPNIALIKYWGKQDLERNLPAVGSLSITLDGLVAATEVRAAAQDSLSINGVHDEAATQRGDAVSRHAAQSGSDCRLSGADGEFGKFSGGRRAGFICGRIRCINSRS